MPPKPSTRVRRRVRVKGGNVVDVVVKVVRDHALYVVCEEVSGLKVGKRAFAIRKGAILVRNVKRDVGDDEYYMIFNDGLYDALRSQGHHVPDGYDREDVRITCYRGSLAWGLQRTWYLSKRSTQADLDAYAERVGSVERSLAKVVDEDKVHAREKAGAAKNPRDRRKRVNFPSRGAIIWSADHGLDRRKGRVRRIRPRVSGRNWWLIALAEEAWKAKVDFEREVTQALRWWDGNAVPSKDVASRMATRFDKLAGSLRSVSVAPYSRRGFPRIADDLGNAACALYEGRFDDARDLLRRCARAFRMMDARRTLEEACTVASRVHKAKAVPTADDIASLVSLLERVEAMLVDQGLPIDLGFEHPVTSDRVLPEITAAKEAARAPEGYQSKETFRALKAAAAPL